MYIKLLKLHLECKNETLLFVINPEKDCLGSCPSHTFYDETKYECVHCHSSCNTCNGGEEENCLSCYTGSQLLDSGDCSKVVCSSG